MKLSRNWVDWLAALTTVATGLFALVKWLNPMGWLSQLVPMWFLLVAVVVVVLVAAIRSKVTQGRRVERIAAPILVPQWLVYVSDSIFGCHWQWVWQSGYEGLEIGNLTALCPTEKCLNELTSVHLPTHSDADRYRCGRCGFQLLAQDAQSRTVYQLRERVKVEIRRRIRTGEYKTA